MENHCFSRLSAQKKEGPLKNAGKKGQNTTDATLEAALEALGEAVGEGCQSGWGRLVTVSYCQLQLPLKLALAVRETVAGHRLGALEGGGGAPALPMHPCHLRLPRARVLLLRTKIVSMSATPRVKEGGRGDPAANARPSGGRAGLWPCAAALRPWGGGGRGGLGPKRSCTKTGPTRVPVVTFLFSHDFGRGGGSRGAHVPPTVPRLMGQWPEGAIDQPPRALLYKSWDIGRTSLDPFPV